MKAPVILALALFCLTIEAKAQEETKPQPEKESPQNKKGSGDLIIREEGVPSKTGDNKPAPAAKAEKGAAATPAPEAKRRKSSLGKARKNASKRMAEQESKDGEAPVKETPKSPGNGG